MTAPIVFIVAGVLLIHGPLAPLGITPSSEVAKVVTEATLALVLFSDASRVGLHQLRADLGLCLRLLGIGLPLAIGLGTLLAFILPGVSDIWLALLIGAALAPTDAALGAGMMVNRAVPARIRRLINVESGLNDGIATPFVLVAIAGAATAEHAASTGPGKAVAELALGLLIGAAVGGGGGWLVKVARGRGIRVQAVLVGLPAPWATASVRRPRLVSAIRARLVLLQFLRTCLRVLDVDVLQRAIGGMLAGMSDALPGTGRHDHDHDGPDHGHDRATHEHRHGSGLLAGLVHLVRPHSHDAGDKVDAAMEASAEGLRALWISLAVLAATAVLQAIVVALSGSVALLGDTLHNAADALTAVPLAVAFVIGRRPPTRRYTYGYGRAEDLAGVVIVLIIAASSALAAYEAVIPARASAPGE